MQSTRRTTPSEVWNSVSSTSVAPVPPIGPLVPAGYTVLAGEAGRVAVQGVAQQPLVGLLAGAKHPLEVHLELDRVADQPLPGLLGLHARTP